jgi:Arc/MetJ-type ribon-helix-helix transcriptional regulator
MPKIKTNTKRFYQTLAQRDIGLIEKLVSEGKYKNRDIFIQMAVKKLLEEEIGSVKMNEEALQIIKKALKIK